jgi:hypothetical protein
MSNKAIKLIIIFCFVHLIGSIKIFQNFLGRVLFLFSLENYQKYTFDIDKN